jgi:hypothetical protein
MKKIKILKFVYKRENRKKDTPFNVYIKKVLVKGFILKQLYLKYAFQKYHLTIHR